MKEVWRAVIWHYGSDGIYRYASRGFDTREEAERQIRLGRNDMILFGTVPELVPLKCGFPVDEVLRYGLVERDDCKLRKVYRYVVWYERDGKYVRHASMEFPGYGTCIPALDSFKRRLRRNGIGILLADAYKRTIPACCGFVYGSDYKIDNEGNLAKHHLVQAPVP